MMKKILALLLLLTVGLSTTWASYSASSTPSVTAGGKTGGAVATVEKLTPTALNPKAGEYANVNMGWLFNITDIHNDYDDKLKITVILMNPHEIKNEFKFAMLNISVWYTDSGGTHYTGTSDIIDLEHPVATLRPTIDLSGSGYKDYYLIRATVTYRNKEHTHARAAVHFEFYCEVKPL